jgi:hypothetical protein
MAIFDSHPSLGIDNVTSDFVSAQANTAMLRLPSVGSPRSGANRSRSQTWGYSDDTAPTSYPQQDEPAHLSTFDPISLDCGHRTRPEASLFASIFYSLESMSTLLQSLKPSQLPQLWFSLGKPPSMLVHQVFVQRRRCIGHSKVSHTTDTKNHPSSVVWQYHSSARSSQTSLSSARRVSCACTELGGKPWRLPT